MSWDKESWIEQKIQPHLDLVQPIKKDGNTVSHGRLWSLKKEIFIYEYIKPYVSIFRSEKNRYTKWCYFDPFSGSGLYDLKIAGNTVKLPGSPLLAYSRNKDYPFSEYFFADLKKKNCQVLSERMNSLFPKNGLKYKPSSFSESVKYFENLDHDNHAVLAVIDPPGFAQIPFEDIKEILKFPTVDMFLTIMTSGIQRNIENDDSYDALTSFFGSEKWVDLGHAENIVDDYTSRLQSITGKYFKKISIDMESQKLYDLFYVSGNSVARKILDDIASKLKQIKLDDLTSIISKNSKDVTTMLDFIDEN